MKKILIFTVICVMVLAVGCKKEEEPIEYYDLPAPTTTQTPETKEEEKPEVARDELAGTAWRNEENALLFEDVGIVSHVKLDTGNTYTYEYRLYSDGKIVFDGDMIFPIEIYEDRIVFNGEEMTKCEPEDVFGPTDAQEAM